MSVWKKVLLLAPLLIVAIGCSDSSTTSPDQSSKITIDSLLPLKMGNDWRLQVKTYDDATGELSGTFNSDFLLGDTTRFEGLPGYSASLNGKPAIIYHSGNDLYFNNTEQEYSDLVARYPMEVGQTDKIFDTTADTYIRKVYFRLVSKNESVTVPAGTFTTYHFQQIEMAGAVEPLDTSTVTNTYFTPNIGFIRQTVYQAPIDSALKLSADVGLVSYTLK